MLRRDRPSNKDPAALRFDESAGLNIKARTELFSAVLCYACAMMPSRIGQLLKFARVFDLVSGFRLWISLLWQLALGFNTLRLSIPGLASPIYLRPSDLPIFWQILVMRENSFDMLLPCPPARCLSSNSLIGLCRARERAEHSSNGLRRTTLRLYSKGRTCSSFALPVGETNSAAGRIDKY
jgi:hypothetical protein